MSVRAERKRDVDSIRGIHEISFPTADEARLVDALRDAGRLTISLVYDTDEIVVAHVAYSPVTIGASVKGLGLGPVAVLPEHRRQGIAERLIRSGLDECNRFGCDLVVVLGDPDYYRRFGFKAASNWRLVDEFGGGDAFQAIELRHGAIPDAGGTVKYSPEFSGLD